MKIAASAFLLVLLLVQVISSPAPYSKQVKNDGEKILYDQRQEGELNIRADLKNFVIMIIPKSPIAEQSTPSASFLDFFRSHTKTRRTKPVSGTNEIPSETMHFIESKTAPYHVDISSLPNHLLNDEITASQTPPVAIPIKITEDATATKDEQQPAALLRQLRSTRFSKAFVLTVPKEDFVLTRMEDDKKVVKKDESQISDKEEMVLLGAAEQCGPEMFRDAEGVCRLRRLVQASGESEASEERDE